MVVGVEGILPEREGVGVAVTPALGVLVGVGVAVRVNPIDAEGEGGGTLPEREGVGVAVTPIKPLVLEGVNVGEGVGVFVRVGVGVFVGEGVGVIIYYLLFFYANIDFCNEIYKMNYERR